MLLLVNTEGMRFLLIYKVRINFINYYKYTFTNARENIILYIIQ